MKKQQQKPASESDLASGDEKLGHQAGVVGASKPASLSTALGLGLSSQAADKNGPAESSPRRLRARR